MSEKKNPHWGTSLDEFLGKEGIREAAKAEALTRVIAWQAERGNGAAGHHEGRSGRADAHEPRAG